MWIIVRDDFVVGCCDEVVFGIVGVWEFFEWDCVDLGVCFVVDWDVGWGVEVDIVIDCCKNYVLLGCDEVV